MNMERINLLLEVFKKSLDVPHTDKIRAEIMGELQEINTPPVVDNDPEPELEIKGRRL